MQPMQRGIKPEEIKTILSKKLPEKQFEYSNFGYGLLGKIIEKVTKKIL